MPESFGRIPIEANRLGVPAIVTNRGALPEIIEDSVTGLISNVDGESLADTIAKAISQNWDRGKIINYTHARFNPSSIAEAFLKFLEHFVAKG